jgi:hypothetical protein
VLDCLDLPPEYSGLLTTDDQETNLHAVPLWMVTQKHMTKILKHYRGRFTNGAPDLRMRSSGVLGVVRGYQHMGAWGGLQAGTPASQPAGLPADSHMAPPN